MSETIKASWLTDHEKTKVAPKTLASQVYNEDGTLFKDQVSGSIEELSNYVVSLNEAIDSKVNKTDIVPADWNQNDDTALDYVKNRTHWTEGSTGVIERSWTLDNSNGWMGGTDLEFATLFHENYKSAVLSSNPETYIENITGTQGYVFDEWYTYVFKKNSNGSNQLYVRIYHDNGVLTGQYSVGEEMASWSTATITITYNNEVVHQLDEKFIPDTIASKDYVESLVKKLNATTALGFYCIEDVTVVTNGVSKTYPANSNVEIVFADDDMFEIIPTSDNSILSLNAFPGALGTYYSWLEGVKQFSNILFDMNAEDMYTKWSQGNQGYYQVQFAQYNNCIFWSDNPYISDVSKRTNYTLFSTSQLPLCYSTIPDNTFKAFYLAFGVNTDPNWSNPAYTESFAKATWATQAFSYYGARIVGFPGHLDITLPKDCRGLMFDARNIEAAGTFDAANCTNFGAKSGSWREAFGDCISLRRLYIKNLKVNLNISWSPVDYDSISYIIEAAANTSAITISVSPYTYNLLSDADFELAASKNITIALLTTNYVEDKRLSAISSKADKDYVDTKIADLVNSAPETLDTLGELATALQDNQSVVDTLNESITNKQNKNVVVYRDSTTQKATMTASEIMEKVRAGDNVYYTPSLTAGTLHPYLEGSNNMVFFYSNYVDNNKVMATGVTIDSQGNIATETFKLAHLTDTAIHITDDERTKWNAITDKADKSYVDEKIANIPIAELATEEFVASAVNGKKDKDVIVTYKDGSSSYSTHSVEQIQEIVNNGGTVYFQKDGELLQLLEVSSYFATFYIFYVNMNNKVQQKVVAISGDTIMLEQDDIYDYATKDSLKNYYLKTEVDKKIADLVNSAPETLDTIGELAAAFQENEEVVDALNQAITNKANATDVLLKEEQTLTDEELTQVRRNLKFIGKDVEGQTFTIDGAAVVASANAEIFGDYENNIAVGQWSIAEGSNTVAKGRVAHAEGAFTKALADGTHTEGYGTEATGFWSHAEGEYTKVTSYASHAEGSYSTMPDGTTRYGTAAGYASHTEGGGCHTIGVASHAEGIGTTANGRCSHVEGIYTIASGKAQHVEGTANIEDTSDKYIHIAGNGEWDARSNAHTLDWQGNAWYSGDVYVGSTSGTNKDEGSKKLVTVEEMNAAIAAAIGAAIGGAY